MSLEIIPLEATYCPSREDVIRYGTTPRVLVIQDLKLDVLRAAESHIEISHSQGLYGQPMTVARLDIVKGLGSVEAVARGIVDHARMQADLDTRMEWDRLRRAQAEFRENLQRSIEEFWGYDECVGRR